MDRARSPFEAFDDDLTPLDLPGRHPRMPRLYKAKNHPQHPKTNPGNSYVFYTRPTEPRMHELLQAGESITLDEEEELNPEAAGLLKVAPGDYVWTRNEAGSRRPEEDIATCWTFGRKNRDQAKMDALDRARDKFMGPEEDITPDSVRFERLDPKPKPVKKNTRCWTLGCSLEPNTNVEAPCANGKAIGEVTEYHGIAHDVVVASTSLAMEDMEQAPEGVKDVLKSEFERHGMAPLGCAGNFAYHAVQCNLAYAGRPMDQDMGRYAGPHRDRGDCPGHYSTMITRSKLPRNYRPARMFLPGIGVYADLEDFDGFTFQALRDHLGSPPYPFPGTSPSPKAYRFALINYTPQRMASADTRQRIGALPTTQAFLAPEMRSSSAEKDMIRGMQEDTFANFIRDGPWIMEDEGFVPYVGRVAYQVVRYLLMQAHPRFEFDLDPIEFARSMTYTTSDGSRESVKPWSMAPSVRGDQDTDRDARRAESEKQFKEHVFKQGSMIPYSYMHNVWIREEVVKRYGPIGIGNSRHGPSITSTEGVSDEGDENGHVHGAQAESSGVGDGFGGAQPRRSTRKRKRLTRESDGETDEETGCHEGHTPNVRARTDAPNSSRMSLFCEYDYQEDEEGAEGRPTTRGRGVGRWQRGKKTPNPQPDELFKPLRSLGAEALEEEVLELRKELLAVEAMEGEDTIDCDGLKDLLEEANGAVELGGIGRRAVKGIRSIIKDAHRLSSHLSQEANRLRYGRRTLIKAQVNIRLWIDGPVKDEAYRAARKGRALGANQTWVSKLTNSIIDMLVHRRAQQTFRAADYGIEWGCKDAVVENKHTGRLMLRGQDDMVRTAVGLSVEVVESWVQADRHCDRKQAWFASIVEEVMGEEALSMNIIWKLYSNIKASHIILGDKGYRSPTKEDTEPFRAALESHGVNDPEHREGRLYELYKQLLNRDISPSDVVKKLPSVSSRWRALKEMVELAALYDDDQLPSTPSPYFKKLQANPHTYHPLRERAPGRVRCRQTLFQHDDSEAISSEAIFSLLAWRAFPQVLSWHPDYSMLHSSPKEFLRAYRAIVKSEPTEGIVSAVETYWKTLDERRWRSFAKTYPTFDQCYQYFKPSGYLENRLFPKLSKASAFDVTCDLVYAGFCQPPTTADVARYIVSLNHGAMAGLKGLGLVDCKKRDCDAKREQVQQALYDLGELLKDFSGYASYETDDERELVLYEEGEVDPMGMEHLIRTFHHSAKYLE
ncbi:hypothetical protein H1R20_g15136, partial [Candolleomyces eurysporus]